MATAALRWTQGRGMEPWDPGAGFIRSLSPQRALSCGTDCYITAFARLVLLLAQATSFFFTPFPTFSMDSSSDSSAFWVFFPLNCFWALFFQPEIQMSETVSWEPAPAGLSSGKTEPGKEKTPKPTSFTCCEEEANTRSPTGSHLFCLSCCVNSFTFPLLQTKGPAAVFVLPATRPAAGWG